MRAAKGHGPDGIIPEPWATSIEIGIMRSKVEPMKHVVTMVRTHFDGIVAWTGSRQTNGFIEAINGLFQAAKTKGAWIHPLPNHENRDLFLIAGKLNFAAINPHAA